MICSESKEPKGSERSSSEHHRCTCSHVKHVHSKFVGSCNFRPCKCPGFVCDHTRCGWKPREEEPEPRCEGCGHTDGEGCGCPPRCACGHTRGQHSPALYGVCNEHPCACLRWRPVATEEPPLTPEEEEEAPGDVSPEEMNRRWAKAMGDDEHDFEGPTLPPPEGPEYTPCVCGHIEPDHFPDAGECVTCECIAYRTEPDFELPPQPDRRPPYAVAYSVQGHLYEVALPGDATVRAVDGVLVIQHHLGPVAGIVSVLPVINEESD